MRKRTLRELCALDARVYVYLADSETCRRFAQQAEREGFTFCDGVKPSARPCADIMALNRDGTLNFVGFVGHVAFGAAGTVGSKPLVRVDYQKYRSGAADFQYRRTDPLRLETL